jgi:hypothetical protein
MEWAQESRAAIWMWAATETGVRAAADPSARGPDQYAAPPELFAFRLRNDYTYITCSNYFPYEEFNTTSGIL